MRVGPDDPIFSRLPLYLVRRYYFDNRFVRYSLYMDRGRALCAAPEEVLVRERQKLEKKLLVLRSPGIRSRTPVIECEIDGTERELDGLEFAALLAEGDRRVAVAQEDAALLKQFPHPAGLFNYARLGGRLEVNFHPDFGHGEHVEYFIASSGTPYGLFSPSSFTQIDGIDRHRSRLIYEELLLARILNKSGRLVDSERLKSFDFMTALTDAQERRVIGMLLYPEKLAAALQRYRQLPDSELQAIARDLPLSGLDVRPDTLPVWMRSLSEEDKRSLFEFFTSRIVSHLISEQIVRSRGILMENRKKEALLLLYEPWEVSSAWLGDLLDFMRSRKPTYQIYAALAYTKAPARRRENLLHPLVEAMRDLERKKYLESASEIAEEFEEEVESIESSAAGLPQTMDETGRF